MGGSLNKEGFAYGTGKNKATDRLEGFAKDSETLEEMVVYRALYGEGGLWVRPARMFFESIERAGKTMKRFELLKGEPK